MNSNIAKMIFGGPGTLSNAELLAVVLGTDTETAEKAFRYADELNTDICKMEVHELAEVEGIGEAKAGRIVAATELSKRIASDRKYRIREKARDSAMVASMLTEDMADETVEKFVVLLLDCKLRIQGKHTIAIGGLDSCPVHPREVFKPAIRNGAAAIIVAHNHPSGDATPSTEDIAITKRLEEASKVIGIQLVDHVIVGTNNFTSMKADGYL